MSLKLVKHVMMPNDGLIRGDLIMPLRRARCRRQQGGKNRRVCFSGSSDAAHDESSKSKGGAVVIMQPEDDEALCVKRRPRGLRRLCEAP